MTQANDTKKQRDIRAEVHRIDGTAHGLSLTFSNGKKLTVYASEVSSSILNEALWHGMKQKLVDAAAISRNPDTGRSATIEDKFSAVHDVYQRLLSGLWNEPREGGGGGSLLFKALCRVFDKKTPEAIRTWLDGKTDAEKAALRKNPKVAQAILDIQAEAAGASDIDTDAMLDELE